LNQIERFKANVLDNAIIEIEMSGKAQNTLLKDRSSIKI